jgi:ABC-2 type transport system ATP-binding protein
MAAEGTPSALKAQIGRAHLEVTISDGGGPRAVEVLARFGEPMPARDGVLMVMLEGGASDVAPIVRALDDAGLFVESLELVKPTLDDVFVAKTGRHLEGSGDEQPREAEQRPDQKAERKADQQGEAVRR